MWWNWLRRWMKNTHKKTHKKKTTTTSQTTTNNYYLLLRLLKVKHICYCLHFMVCLCSPFYVHVPETEIPYNTSGYNSLFFSIHTKRATILALTKRFNVKWAHCFQFELKFFAFRTDFNVDDDDDDDDKQRHTNVHALTLLELCNARNRDITHCSRFQNRPKK